MPLFSAGIRHIWFNNLRLIRALETHQTDERQGLFQMSLDATYLLISLMNIELMPLLF